MRIAMVLPGLHRVTRGAEVAFEAIAHELGKRSDVELTLFGSGQKREGDPYNFQHVDNVPREYFEQWPKFPVFRSEYAYEEFTFMAGLMNCYRPEEFDLTVTCSYPFLNWFLRWRGGKQRPAHVFVTQNSDYPATANRKEFRYFGCDGLVCTNPDYFERNKDRWRSELIPNGVDPEVFLPGSSDRQTFGLPVDVPIVLMVSALISSKRVAEGIQAVSKISNAHLVVCGDGPERERIGIIANECMPGRFHLKKLTRKQMPDIYQIADVFLHMSLDEPSANAYIEALSTGLAIVTHSSRVTQWTLNSTGYLIDTRNSEDVTKAINEALTTQSSEKILARRNLVLERFSWQKLENEYHKFFQTIAADFGSFNHE
jgi:glycosyltransferase involved in cell wall biosynthesis